MNDENIACSYERTLTHRSKRIKDNLDGYQVSGWNLNAVLEGRLQQLVITRDTVRAIEKPKDHLTMDPGPSALGYEKQRFRPSSEG